MAAPNSRWRRFLTSIGQTLKAQWLATALFAPLAVAIIVLGLQVHFAREDAREARLHTINADRISKIQDSGKALDLALAAYFQSIAELGVAQQGLRMPGAHSVTPIPRARSRLVETRERARTALAEHASDIQRLRGSLDRDSATRYMSALADIQAVVEGTSDIQQTGGNITALSRLVVARNALVDDAMRPITS